MKTIIVEDSRLARNEMRELLKKYAHIEICGEAENIEQAIRLIESQNTELLLLDINLPDGTGFDLRGCI